MHRSLSTGNTVKPLHWLLLVALLSGIVLAGSAQNAPTFADWVRPNQTYLQIKVGADGIYKLPASLLSTHFPDLNSLNPAGFQLFRRGKEQAIFVSAGSDNLLNGSDYIEFTGFMNDGLSELEMYQKPLAAINEYRSIYDDTAHYFLTWSGNLNGRRVADPGFSNNNSVPFETYHWRTSGSFPNQQYALGRGLRGNVTYSSYFTPGEGWSGRAFSAGFGEGLNNTSFFNYIGVNRISNLFTGGAQPILELLQYGRQPVNQKVRIVLSFGQSTLDTVRFVGLTSNLLRKSFNPTLIENGTLNIWAVPLEATNISNAYARVIYPATFQMPNGENHLSLELNPNSFNYSRIRMDNLGSLPDMYDVSDPANPIRITPGFVGGSYVAGIENTGQSRRIFLNRQSTVLGPALVEKCSFTPFNPANFDYLIITHPLLRRPVQGVNDPVQAYADYRSSPAGGNHRVLVMEMKEIYQRFGYGDRSPLSIRNFCGYFIQNQVRVKALFLMGKGITVNNRFNPFFQKANMIPTFGVPASDNAYTVGLGEPGRSIAFPVGRLAAYTPEQVLTYLNKVRETEAFRYDDLWKKNVFHISGGLNRLEQSSFSNIMRNELRNRVAGPFMGANVGVFSKTSNQTVEYADIRAILNSGISMLTMFGHSSRFSPDVEIGYASDPTQGFNNAGKYPLVIVNGCFTGNIYEFDQSLNEDWIFTPNKGAVMFWAASDEGLSALLRRHMNEFYSVAFQDSSLFGEPFGVIQKETMRRYLATLSSEPQLDSAFMHQFTLHGDPMLRIFGAAKPDLKTSNAEVFLATANPNAGSPFVRIGTIISNFGRFTKDSIGVRVSRRFSDGTTQDFVYQVKPVKYLDTVYFDLPQNEALSYSGNNRFEVFLDFLNEVDEMNEGNNSGFFEYFIPSTGILPLFPKEYALVGSRNVKLTVQATDFFSPGRRYVFQLDTSASFNSPLFIQSPEVPAGNVCTWNALLPIDRDSTVYFWRVRFADRQSPSDTTWYNMSFEYIKNVENGWAQSHFFQFRKSQDQGIEKNFALRKWQFPTQSTFVDLEVSGGSKQGPQQYSLFLDGISVLTGAVSSSNCFKTNIPRLVALTLDKCSLKPKFWNYSGDPIGYYLTGCGRLPFAVNIFEMNPGYNTLRVYFKEFINEIVKTGDYVVLFPVDSVVMDSVRKYGSEVLPRIGVDPAWLTTLQNGNPFIIFGKKTENPNPGTAEMIRAVPNGIPFNRQVLSLKKSLNSACASGTILSTRIGPASQWKNLFRRFADEELPDREDQELELRGVRLDGRDTVLQKNVPGFPFNLAGVPAEEFPYLQLVARVNDTANFTPANLRRWMVTYEGVPEGVMNTTLIPTAEYQTGDRHEGDSLSFRFAFTNISNKAYSDSIPVRFSLNGQPSLETRIPALAPDSTAQFRYPRFSTLGKAGSNQLTAIVNPRVLPEEYYENNGLSIPFRVISDRIQPVLDVTFDGIKIMNGDFVSSSPVVGVALKDENRFLLKRDTVGMALFLTRPCSGCSVERIPFQSPQVRIFPAGSDNLFRIEYRPGKLENGMHRLAVQGTDVKGNPSGTQLYQVEFNVTDQNTITHFYPYPNPFSTSCQWVFTLTGQMPEDFKIQILTVTGRVVREIMKDELGPLRIGNNITSYRWNGTDEYGDRLANGVYLYRVVMKEGQTFTRRKTDGDHTFTKEFGKLYIIR